MALFRRRKVIPSEAIDTLLRHLSEPDKSHAENFIERVNPDHRDAFLDKMYLYHLALVMVCLLAREKKDIRFIGIRKIFEEKIIFPMFHTNGGEPMAVMFMEVMREIGNLEKPIAEARPLSWGRGWFAAIGVDMPNPVDLTLFVVLWQQKLHHTLKLLNEIGDEY